MCCWSDNRKDIASVFNSDDQQVNLSSEDNLNLNELPEHVDNLLLNRNVHKGILGFRYETKDIEIIVYTSIEAKTFAWSCNWNQ